jgi:hypothetical protein
MQGKDTRFGGGLSRTAGSGSALETKSIAVVVFEEQLLQKRDLRPTDDDLPMGPRPGVPGKADTSDTPTHILEVKFLVLFNLQAWLRGKIFKTNDLSAKYSRIRSYGTIMAPGCPLPAEDGAKGTRGR